MKKVTTEHDFIYLSRVIGSFAVVLLHSFGAMPMFRLVSFSSDWWLYKIFTYLFIWANPLFVMISGALLLGQARHMSLRAWYHRRWLRIGAPMIFWIVFYALYFHFDRGDVLTWTVLLNKALYGPVGHLHFLIAIVELYVLAPLFQACVQKLNSQEFLSLTLLFVFLTVVLPKQTVTLFYFIPYISFFLLGYHLLKVNNDISVRICLIGLFLTTMVSVGWESLNISGPVFFNQTFEPLLGHIGIPSLLSSTFVFILLIRTQRWLFHHVSKIEIKKISEVSFGIYLIHPLILNTIVSQLQQRGFIDDVHWYHSITLITLVYLLSYFIVRVIRRNEFMRKYIIG